MTTRNRRELFLQTLANWQEHLPADCVLVVVDDASDDPVPSVPGVTVIRHDNRLGVSMAKNRGITELIDRGCRHIFIADDDVHPITDDWWQPYVESPEPHLMYGWTHQRFAIEDGTGWPPRIVAGDQEHDAYSFPRGVMLYIESRVVDVVGGMNTAHGAFSGEHVEYSGRVHAAGLTSWAFADVKHSDQLWYARDKEIGNTHGSSFPLHERRRLHKTNGMHWDRRWEGWPYFPNREGARFQDYSRGPHIEPFEHYALLRHTVGLHPSGTALEFGVGPGQSTRIIANALPVVGFDSFTGLQEDWRPQYPKGSFANEPPAIPNTRLVIGLFEDTLPGFTFPEYVGLVHIDCDTYQATKTVLEHVGKHLQPGAYVVFDEFWDYDDGPGSTWADHEHKAWHEYAAAAGVGWAVVASSHEAWGIRIL